MANDDDKPEVALDKLATSVSQFVLADAIKAIMAENEMDASDGSFELKDIMLSLVQKAKKLMHLQRTPSPKSTHSTQFFKVYSQFYFCSRIGRSYEYLFLIFSTLVLNTKN